MTDGGADSASPWPASILLARQAYVAASRNDTKARSTGNHTVEVTFWIADPPAVSFCTWHCSKAADLKDPPEVVGAQGRFVLLRAVFASGYYYSKDEEEEYLVYTGDPRSPSLESIPLPEDEDGLLLRLVDEFGIVPRGGEDAGGHYLLVALRSAETSLKEYRLHVYSSEDRTWRSKEVANPCPGEYAIWPDKVITVADGVLAWVSLQQGMVVCDVLQEDEEPLHERYIPLPAPLLESRQDTYLKQFRDVACVDGLIKFVEVEHRVIVTEIREEPLLDPRDKGCALRFRPYRNKQAQACTHQAQDPSHHERLECHDMDQGAIGSDCWRKGSIVDVDDISRMMNPLGSCHDMNLYSAWPTLCEDGNDMLYLKSSRHLTESNKWVVAVDLAKKTLKVEAPGEHPFGGCPPWQQICHPCALANHLKMTLANQGQDGAQRSAQNDLSSQAHPNQNNKPPQLCFNRWAEPGYGGYSSWSWPHQNIPPPPPPLPPQCLNVWPGPCPNPMYALRAPCPDMCAYDNYQPPWQQPLPQEQQTTPSIAFGPHQVKKLVKLMIYDPVYHGSSQQWPAGNSFSYGAHSGNANFH
ncbi:hypothetical protein VPH35_119018 [Triticum aestivum]